MPRGKYVDVTYRTGAGITTHRTTAHSIGADVEIEDSRGSTFIVVREVNVAKKPVQTALFTRSEVVSIVEGQLAPVGKK